MNCQAKEPGAECFDFRATETVHCEVLLSTSFSGKIIIVYHESSTVPEFLTLLLCYQKKNSRIYKKRYINFTFLFSRDADPQKEA